MTTTTSPTPGTATEREVARVIRGRPASDGAGVRMLRLIGTPDLPDLDPFLMLDHFDSGNAGDYIAGFPDHPHRGFETVTYMLHGRMRHRDNKGNEGLLVPGGVQWMTAGSGLIHSEMPEQQEGLMRGFQLWLNLPAAEKMTTPGYRDLAPEEIPVAHPAPGTTVRVIAGRVGEVAGPVAPRTTEPILLDVGLEPGAEVVLDLPAGHAAFLFAFEGEVAVGPDRRAVARGSLAVLGEGARLRLAAQGDQPASILVAAARPLREPVAKYGPFVMNTPDQIRQAIFDYQAGRF